MLKFKKIGIVTMVIGMITLPIFAFANENSTIFTFSDTSETTTMEKALDIFKNSNGEDKDIEDLKIDSAKDATVEGIELSKEAYDEKKKEQEKARLEKIRKAEEIKKAQEKKEEQEKVAISKNANDMIYYMMKKNGSISKSTATQIYNSVMKHSKTYGVDPYLVFAIIEQESTYNPNCSYEGAYGLMQLYHSTLPYLGITKAEVFDIDANIRAGVYEISGNLRTYGNETVALSAYNWGSGNVNRGNYTTAYARSVLGRKNNIKTIVN